MIDDPHKARVVFAHECDPCPDCGEPVCRVCEMHYADCDCPGPHMDDYYAYTEGPDGVLYAIPRGMAMSRKTN